tara:strand:- start:5719 stop:5928 length:210 start_codon:yes stop_codon:yes gene_type:complete
MPTYITIKETIEKKIPVTKNQFEVHGVWSENNVHISIMYKHKPTGKIFYEDCEQVRDRKFDIVPFNMEK